MLLSALRQALTLHATCFKLWLQQLCSALVKGHNALLSQSAATVILFGNYLQAVHIDSATKAFCYKFLLFSVNIFVAAITIGLCFIQSSVHVTMGLAKCGLDGRTIGNKSLLSFGHLRRRSKEVMYKWWTFIFVKKTIRAWPRTIIRTSPSPYVGRQFDKALNFKKCFIIFIY